MNRRRFASVCLALVASAVVWLRFGPERIPVEALPSADETMLQVSRRLGERFSPKVLQGFENRGDLVLRQLTRSERFALGRNHIRFRVQEPTRVAVAAPVGFEPFWLADQGFLPAGERISDEDVTYSLHEKTFGPGWVGLGINALDRRSPAHYRVFLTSSRTDLRTELAFESSDRHRHALVAGKAWKTHVPSLPTPDQIVVSFGSDAARSIGINWRTQPETEGTLAEIRRADAPESETTRRWEGRSETVRSYGLINDPVIRRHMVEIGGLHPATTYLYRVGDGSPRGWSRWREVKTGPAAGSPYRIMYLGDAQCGLENWGKLLTDAVRRHPDVGAILLAGDLVDRGNERGNWDHFFLRGRGVLDRVPFLPAVGNHEYLDRGPVHYRASFTLPENGPGAIPRGLVYSCEIGDTFIGVLDSNLAKYDRDQAAIQADWLSKAVARSTAAWRLVMFHHPVHASHPTRENPEIESAWAETFERLGIDLVLQGHDHAYMRTPPLRGRRPVSEGEHAPIYVVSVSGDKYCDQDTRGLAAQGYTRLSTYQLLDVDPTARTLLYRAFDAHGNEKDRVLLRKSNAGPIAAAGRSRR